MPPIGAAVLPNAGAYPSSTLTVPLRSRAAIASPSARLPAQTLAFRPYSVSLARAMASSTSSTG